MYAAPAEVIEGLKEFDSATVFNAVVESIGGSQGGLELEGKGGVPENYTGPGIRCLLPELGAVVGYAVTSEVTTNDPDSEPASWEDYYDLLDKTPSPIVAVMKDVDSPTGPGRLVRRWNGGPPQDPRRHGSDRGRLCERHRGHQRGGPADVGLRPSTGPRRLPHP